MLISGTKNKDKLEQAIREYDKINECEYQDLMKLVVKYILNGGDEYKTYDENDIPCFGSNDYQGTMFWVIKPPAWEVKEII